MLPERADAVALVGGALQRGCVQRFAAVRTGKQRIYGIGEPRREVADLAAAVLAAIPADGQSVGNRRTRRLAVCPVPPRRLKDVQLVSVHDQKAVVVIERMVVAAVAALPVPRQQFQQHFQRGARGFAALERQPQHVHAGQPLLLIGTARPHRFVADANAAVVHAHLTAPQPCGLREQQAMRLPHLLHRHIGCLHRRLAMDGRLEIPQHLRLIGASVAVLRKKRRSVCIESNRITHTASLPHAWFSMTAAMRGCPSSSPQKPCRNVKIVRRSFFGRAQGSAIFP